MEGRGVMCQSCKEWAGDRQRSIEEAVKGARVEWLKEREG